MLFDMLSTPGAPLGLHVVSAVSISSSVIFGWGGDVDWSASGSVSGGSDVVAVYVEAPKLTAISASNDFCEVDLVFIFLVKVV